MRQNHGGRTAEEQNIAQPEEEYGGWVVDSEKSHRPDKHLEVRPFVYESAHRSSNSQDGWVFDSGATSMSTGDRSIFQYIDKCLGMLKVASRTHIPIRGRGIARI